LTIGITNIMKYEDEKVIRERRFVREILTLIWVTLFSLLIIYTIVWYIVNFFT